MRLSITKFNFPWWLFCFVAVEGANAGAGAIPSVTQSAVPPEVTLTLEAIEGCFTGGSHAHLEKTVACGHAVGGVYPCAGHKIAVHLQRVSINRVRSPRENRVVTRAVNIKCRRCEQAID